jgi:hypothetical protein
MRVAPERGENIIANFAKLSGLQWAILAFLVDRQKYPFKIEANPEAQRVALCRAVSSLIRRGIVVRDPEREQQDRESRLTYGVRRKDLLGALVFAVDDNTLRSHARDAWQRDQAQGKVSWHSPAWDFLERLQRRRTRQAYARTVREREERCDQAERAYRKELAPMYRPEPAPSPRYVLGVLGGVVKYLNDQGEEPTVEAIVAWFASNDFPGYDADTVRRCLDEIKAIEEGRLKP